MGIESLQARLTRIVAEVNEALKPALEKGGNEIADAARKLAPEDTGDLKASIAVTLAGQSTPPYSQPGGSQVVPEGAAMVTVGNSQTRYPHLVEYGTADAPAQPFFWPAYRLLRRRVSNRIKRALGKAVRDGWGR